jgi:hypothetical protein
VEVSGNDIYLTIKIPIWVAICTPNDGVHVKIGYTWADSILANPSGRPWSIAIVEISSYAVVASSLDLQSTLASLGIIDHVEAGRQTSYPVTNPRRYGMSAFSGSLL